MFFVTAKLIEIADNAYFFSLCVFFNYACLQTKWISNKITLKQKNSIIIISKAEQEIFHIHRFFAL